MGTSSRAPKTIYTLTTSYHYFNNAKLNYFDASHISTFETWCFFSISQDNHRQRGSNHFDSRDPAGLRNQCKTPSHRVTRQRVCSHEKETDDWCYESNWYSGRSRAYDTVRRRRCAALQQEMDK